MKVSELMSSSVVSVSPSDTVQMAAVRMKEADVGCLPVIEANNLRGMITDRDIVLCGVAGGRHPKEVTVADCETRRVWSVDPEADAEEAARIMKERQIRRLPVVKGGEVVGMLSLADLARRGEMHQLSEEVLSEVSKPAAGARR